MIKLMFVKVFVTLTTPAEVAKMRISILPLLFFWFVAGPSMLFSQSPEGPEDIHFQVENVHLKKGELFVVRYVPDMKEEPVKTEQFYHVMVPYVEDGVTKVRAEQRTRTVMTRPNVKKLIKVTNDYRFFNVAGDKFDPAKLIAEFGDKPRRFILLPMGIEKIPDTWAEFLKPDVILMKEPTQ